MELIFKGISRAIEQAGWQLGVDFGFALMLRRASFYKDGNRLAAEHLNFCRLTKMIRTYKASFLSLSIECPCSSQWIE